VCTLPAHSIWKRFHEWRGYRLLDQAPSLVDQPGSLVVAANSGDHMFIEGSGTTFPAETRP
jgi:hypothetical protein